MPYSVLTEPVIPVLWPNGTSSAVGIREVFLRAHEIRDIQGETPLERYALLRLLIAFAMDMLHPRTSYERRDLLDEGCFDQAVFDQYIALCEQDGPRFDLFDPDHPFMQSKYDEELDAKAEKPVASIVHSLPSGNNPVFIDHRYETEYALPYEKALCKLCSAYLFCVAGLAGPKKDNFPSSVNNRPPFYVTIVGKSLFETIIWNMLSESELRNSTIIGKAPWRTEYFIQPYEKVNDISFIDGLTWMSRRITLISDRDGYIRKIYYQAGKDFIGNRKWVDPYVPRITNSKTFEKENLVPKLGREFWQDAGSLLYESNQNNGTQPQIITCLSNILDDTASYVHIRVVGLVTDKAKFEEWIDGELCLPEMVLNQEEKAYLFRADIAMIEKLQSVLFVVVKNVIDKPQKEEKLKKVWKDLVEKKQIDSDKKTREIALQCQRFFSTRSTQFTIWRKPE